MFADETTDFLAIDFDGDAWQQDISAFHLICFDLELRVAVERSRSGNGAHVWFFFNEPIPSALARKFGSGLLTRAMASRHEIKFRSYDRLFPNQDTIPKGGFGNLIALPLQGRARKNENSLFIDENLVPFLDQWAFLSSICKIAREQLETWVAALNRGGELVGLKWDAIDFERKTLTIKHTVTEVRLDGKTVIIAHDRTKTKSSYRTLPLVEPFEALLNQLRVQHERNQEFCGNVYNKHYLEYIYVDAGGERIRPNYLSQHFALVLEKNNLKKIRFH